MSAPSNVPCPEPIPYSDNIYGYSDIDFNVAAPVVQSLQPVNVSVDSILANQLGPVTNPVTPSRTSDVSGFPVLPVVGENDAKPLLSSYAGADINLPTTLSNGNASNVSVNDIVNVAPPAPVLSTPSVPQEFTNVNRPRATTKAVNVKQPTVMTKEQFNNIQNKNAPKKLANFISKRQPEHFTNPRKIEHFYKNKLTIMDNIVIIIIILAFIYYAVSLKHGELNINLSKVPILSQLTDSNVSTENKVIIVFAVVIAFVLIGRMMK